MDKKIIPISAARVSGYNAEREREQNAVGRQILRARKRRGLSLTETSELLESFGLKASRTSINKWENGVSIPTAYQLIALSAALGVGDRISYFTEAYVPELNEAGERKLDEYKADLIATGKYRPVPSAAGSIRYIDMPVSSLAVSAGTGEFLDDANFETVSFPEDRVPDGADFGVRISGDSMEPVYHNGQIVWVQKCERLDAGQVGVFVCDGEGYLKLYTEQAPEEDAVEEYTDSYGVTHAQPVLVSYNPKYMPRVVRPGSHFQIIGRVL
jgi:phage repressor protein C with HTH and peptisase S24 domain